ncbi:hypothetical protein NGRA_2603 [Nosema granulosis]|uniref:Uncharacterized protein n=1 Tax=Nosema granulosis TaxID=83296 RepID=A0A9P6KYA0_9MICR|nr:hypothetical protein NGRA_2603 [Nosema granulosis]
MTNDLIILFLNHEIDKEGLKNILKINNIAIDDFNKEVKKYIEELKLRKRSSLKVASLLDSRFKKEILAIESPSVNKSPHGIFFFDKKLDFDYVYRNSGFLTYKSARRLLSVEELVYKAKEYLRAMNMSLEVDERSISLISKSLEFLLKNVFDGCGDNIDFEKVMEILKKHTKILNLYSLQ